MSKLLIDKYQPKYLDDFNYSNDYILYLKTLILNTDLNILLFGNIGCGKTLLIDAILYYYYDISSLYKIKNNLLYISNLKEQGISFYKNDVKNFCQSTSEIYGKKKTIIIDNLDGLSEINQNIFKMHMDIYSKKVNFICSCTNLNKISSSIINHFIVIKINNIDEKLQVTILDKIILEEQLNISEDIKKYIIKYSNGSIKLLINNLEKYRLLNDKINYKVENINNNTLIKDLLEYYNLCLKKDRDIAYKKLLEIYYDGYSIIDIIEYMYGNLKTNDNILTSKKYNIIKILSKYLLKINNINDDELIIYFMTNDIIDIL